mgnify:CR=1 FL=1|tara:strand:+ start:164 stop:532 length:369 start_codon:yes stop_codon:yes gene_type:complete
MKSKIDYVEALGNLMQGIKESYAGWGSDIDSLDEPSKSIRLKMIDEFNSSLDVKSGRKFDKIISNGSVWGFVAKDDGVLKGIPHKMGDVFKAAGWRAPAKWARGSIFSDDKFYSWTGPNYLI